MSDAIQTTIGAAVAVFAFWISPFKPKNVLAALALALALIVIVFNGGIHLGDDRPRAAGVDDWGGEYLP